MAQIRPLNPISPRTFELSSVDMVTKRMYGSTMLAFRLSPLDDIQKVFDEFCYGLKLSLNENPLLAGHICKKPGAPGRLQVVVPEDASVSFDMVDLRSCTSSRWPHGNFAQLEAQGFPTHVTQYEPLLLPPNITTLEKFPCFVGQVTFIDGGCFYWWGIPHPVADGGCRAFWLPRWAAWTAAASNGIFLRPEPLPEGAFDRTTMSTGISPAEVAKLPTTTQTTAPSNDPASLTIWYLSAEKYSILKHLATSSNKEDWISSADAVNALLWTAVSRARQLEQRGFEQSSFYSAVDIRRRLNPPLPLHYWGNAAGLCPVAAPVSLVCGEPVESLKKTAIMIRRSLTNFDANAVMPELIGRINGVLNGTFSGPVLTMNANNGPDLLSSSHQSEDIFQQYWGRTLGRPVAFRAPAFGQAPATDGTININPRMVDGSVEIMTAFDHATTQRLRQDKFLRRFLEPRDTTSQSRETKILARL